MLMLGKSLKTKLLKTILIIFCMPILFFLAGRGSYLVKRSDSFPGNFTLHLNTGRKIEKVLIKRSKKGSYEVGLRNYKWYKTKIFVVFLFLLLFIFNFFYI